MKIAIHDRRGSFSDRWLQYCHEKGYDYTVVDCLNNEIIKTLEEYDILLWHWELGNHQEILFAKKILFSIAHLNIKVYPNFQTCWHYDDKISQKYLLESVCNYSIPTYIFYNIGDAYQWIENSTFPKVFKLSKGAASTNVSLVHTPNNAKKLVKQAFGRGFSHSGLTKDVRHRLRKHQLKKDYFDVIKRLPSTLRKLYIYNKSISREANYVYFQDFMPGNSFDTRVIIIGDKAFAFRRFVRDNDFRASGSGIIDYSPENINLESILISFDVANRLNTQTLALDFISNEEGELKIVEISYSFPSALVRQCKGYWLGKELVWREGIFWAQDQILNDLIST